MCRAGARGRAHLGSLWRRSASLLCFLRGRSLVGLSVRLREREYPVFGWASVPSERPHVKFGPAASRRTCTRMRRTFRRNQQ
jgi:hypothetical protein